MRGVDGLILAGGRARRMGGGDKGLIAIGARSILARIVATLAPQVDHLLLSANGDPARFAALGLPVVADERPDVGPLGGLLAGLDWTASHRPDVATVLSVPGDTPVLPRDLAARLLSARGSAAVAAAMSGGILHPTVALWPVAARHDLRRFLRETTRCSVRAFAETLGLVPADWQDEARDPFANVNTPDDLARARRGMEGEPP